VTSATDTTGRAVAPEPVKRTDPGATLRRSSERGFTA
jgi:hypothetical protein